MKMFFLHLHIIEKYFRDKFTIQFFSPSTLIIGTMPIWGTTDSLMHNGWGEVNRSRYTYYDLGVSLHNAYGLNIPTKVDVIQYLDRERWIQ